MNPSTTISPPQEAYKYFDSLDRAFNEILHTSSVQSNPNSIEKFSITKLLLKNIISSGEAPSLIFTLLGTGSFKECYDSGQTDWVMKFCTTENNTLDEQRLYSEAIETGIGDLFPETKYIKLPRLLPAIELETEGISEITSEGIVTAEYKMFDTLILQRKIITLELYDEAVNYNKSKDIDDAVLYEENPIIAGEYIMPLRLFNTIDAPYRWLKEVLDYYGNEIFQAFCEFCEDNAIQDLHTGNIGYIIDDDQKIPVIIDWLSFSHINKKF